MERISVKQSDIQDFLNKPHHEREQVLRELSASFYLLGGQEFGSGQRLSIMPKKGANGNRVKKLLRVNFGIEMEVGRPLTRWEEFGRVKWQVTRQYILKGKRNDIEKICRAFLCHDSVPLDYRNRYYVHANKIADVVYKYGSINLHNL